MWQYMRLLTYYTRKAVSLTQLLATEFLALLAACPALDFVTSPNAGMKQHSTRLGHHPRFTAGDDPKNRSLLVLQQKTIR